MNDLTPIIRIAPAPRRRPVLCPCGAEGLIRMATERFPGRAEPGVVIRTKTYRCTACGVALRTAEVVLRGKD
jgi:hypothetical protein